MGVPINAAMTSAATRNGRARFRPSASSEPCSNAISMSANGSAIVKYCGNAGVGRKETIAASAVIASSSITGQRAIAPDQERNCPPRNPNVA